MKKEQSLLTILFLSCLVACSVFYFLNDEKNILVEKKEVIENKIINKNEIQYSDVKKKSLILKNKESKKIALPNQIQASTDIEKEDLFKGDLTGKSSRWVPPPKDLPPPPPVPDFEKVMSGDLTGESSRWIPPGKNHPKAPPLPNITNLMKGDLTGKNSKWIPPSKDLAPPPPLPALNSL